MRLVVGDYVMDYDLAEGTVNILAIRHGRQQDPDLLKDKDAEYED